MHHFCTFLVEVRENIKPLFSLLPRSRFAVPPEKLFAHQSSEFDLFFFQGASTRSSRGSSVWVVSDTSFLVNSLVEGFFSTH